jgi:hypothetical protein
LDHRINKNGKYEFLVRWKDYEDDYDWWVKDEDFDVAIVKNYLKSIIPKKRNQPRRILEERNDDMDHIW